MFFVWVLPWTAKEHARQSDEHWAFGAHENVEFGIHSPETLSRTYNPEIDSLCMACFLKHKAIFQTVASDLIESVAVGAVVRRERDLP